MSLHLVTELDYSGTAGVLQVRSLLEDLNNALAKEDWEAVRRLNLTCAVLIDRVILANRDDDQVLALVLALNELKDVYAELIIQCHYQVAAMSR